MIENKSATFRRVMSEKSPNFNIQIAVLKKKLSIQKNVSRKNYIGYRILDMLIKVRFLIFTSHSNTQICTF